MTNGFSADRRPGSRRFRVAVATLAAAVLLAAPGRPVAEAPAHADAARSLLREGWFGRSLAVEIALDRAVPFRVFTLDAPPRLVIDFAGLDWTGFDPQEIRRDGGVAPVRVGRVGSASRLLLDLDAPLALEAAEMRPNGGGARLHVALRRVGAGAFAAASGAPPGVWPSGRLPRPAVRGTSEVTVAIDPGHGGPDPGAVRDKVEEKTLVLAFGRALGAALVARGFRVLMTRDADDYLALDDRVAAARAAGADVFLSLHVNAEADPRVAGAIAFTRADRGSSPQAAARARAENASDAIAGLGSMDDPVRETLVGMARTETDARSGVLADVLVAALRPVATIWTEPRQAADFEVLRAPDVPSVLLELGFLSNPDDRAALLSPAWREAAAGALAAGLESWLTADAALAGKLRR